MMIWAYLIVFGWCFLSASILPISSEPAFIALVIAEKKWVLPVIVATLGNIAGGFTTFYLAQKGGEIVFEKLSEKNKKKYLTVKKMILKWGPFIMVTSWVPFLGDIVVGIGGAMKLPLAPSLFWMALGKFLRYWLLGLFALDLLKIFF